MILIPFFSGLLGVWHLHSSRTAHRFDRSFLFPYFWPGGRSYLALGLAQALFRKSPSLSCDDPALKWRGGSGLPRSDGSSFDNSCGYCLLEAERTFFLAWGGFRLVGRMNSMYEDEINADTSSGRYEYINTMMRMYAQVVYCIQSYTRTFHRKDYGAW